MTFKLYHQGDAQANVQAVLLKFVKNLTMPSTDLDESEPAVQSEVYDLYLEEAQRVVNLVLSQSLDHIRTGEENLENQNQFQPSEDDQWGKIASIPWPKISEFTDESVGLNKIIEYIEQVWKGSAGGPDPCWLYAVDFIVKKTFDFTILYVYRARFSIPTRRQPIPRHTASIYFTFDVSKVRPKDTTVGVSFVVETMRLLHTPEKFRFRQKWLENIILLKEKLAEGIDF